MQGADQALYNGFGAAGMHAAAVHQPPFGQVRRRTGERAVPASGSSKEKKKLHSQLYSSTPQSLCSSIHGAKLTGGKATVYPVRFLSCLG
jgi:hypothetical protein